jgi:predicted porin
MKKLFLTATTTALVSLSPLVTADGPIDGKVYGKLNISLVNADNGTDDIWELNSNASRLGFKGATTISDELEVFYKAEFEICADDGDCSKSNADGQTFKQRNIVVGVKGDFGSLMAGKNDTPTKLAQKKIDLFNDSKGDIKNTFSGENRLSNIIVYSTPKVNGVSATLAVVPGEGSNGTGISDSTSYAISYSKDNLYVAIAGDQDVKDQDLLRIVSQYKIDDLKLGFMYQDSEKNDGSSDESGYFFSAAYKIDKITYKAQFGSLEDDADGDEEQTFSLGADYKLAKNTKAFVFFTDNADSSEDGSNSDETSFGIGLEHKF